MSGRRRHLDSGSVASLFEDMGRAQEAALSPSPGQGGAAAQERAEAKGKKKKKKLQQKKTKKKKKRDDDEDEDGSGRGKGSPHAAQPGHEPPPRPQQHGGRHSSGGARRSAHAPRVECKPTSNGANADGSSMNVGNQLGDRPSIRLHPKHSSGDGMKNIFAEIGRAQEAAAGGGGGGDGGGVGGGDDDAEQAAERSRLARERFLAKRRMIAEHRAKEGSGGF